MAKKKVWSATILEVALKKALSRAIYQRRPVVLSQDEGRELLRLVTETGPLTRWRYARLARRYATAKRLSLATLPTGRDPALDKRA